MYSFDLKISIMSKVLKLLLEGEHLSKEQIAEILGMSMVEVESEFKRLKDENVILGWRPVLHPTTAAEGRVRAAIEVKISPEREGGFDRLAERISRFDNVESCHLMSGGYDLLAIVQGETLHEVAAFVSEKLATIGGVLSTQTHFLLRSYKEQGFFIGRDNNDPDRPAVSA